MRLLLLVGILALAFPGAAAAHATLIGISPPTQARLEVPPRAVVLRFDQSVATTARALEVFSAEGRRVSGAPTAGDGGRDVRVPLSGLSRGAAYAVRWRATSSDGHTGSGVYTFGIGVIKLAAPISRSRAIAAISSALSASDDRNCAAMIV